MKRKYFYCAALLLFFALISVWISGQFYQRSAALALSGVVLESDEFRAQKLSDRMLESLAALHSQSSMPMGELLSIFLPGTGSGLISLSNRLTPVSCLKWKQLLMKYNRDDYDRISSAYGAVWDDVVYFPVAAEGISYENSWMFERSYGGSRGHEGTDLMPPENLSGHYPVVSMTDGVVEQIGWLELGGYRIGIRSPSGGYYYYAHLDSYSSAFEIGDEIDAGDELGLMGDTGYGEEGTRGKFDVHLHLGIYIRTEAAEELSVNPYWVLRYLQIRDLP